MATGMPRRVPLRAGHDGRDFWLPGQKKAATAGTELDPLIPAGKRDAVVPTTPDGRVTRRNRGADPIRGRCAVTGTNGRAIRIPPPGAASAAGDS